MVQVEPLAKWGTSGFPALILSVLTALLKKRRAQIFFLSLTAFVLCAFIVSDWFGAWELSTALDYCESLTSETQGYKQQHDKYPDDLAQIGAGSDVIPLRRLFHGADAICGYEAVGGRSFSFRMYSSGSFPSYWEYENGRWRHVD